MALTLASKPFWAVRPTGLFQPTQPSRWRRYHVGEVTFIHRRTRRFIQRPRQVIQLSGGESSCIMYR